LAVSKREEIRSDFLQGKIRPYELDKLLWREVYDEDPALWAEACKQASLMRLESLEFTLKIKLNAIRNHFVDISAVKRGSAVTAIEQQIGGAVVPLGIAGPLKVRGEYAEGEFYLPLATSEAALIAGMNRGCKIINESGGVRVKVTREGMTRAPVIETPGIIDAYRLSQEIASRGDLYQTMKEAAESESTVSRLLDIQVYQLGRHLWLRFVFQTGDSMGMNSATRYAANAIRVLNERYSWARLVALSGNLCTDKKDAHINALLGRGKSVESELVIPRRCLLKSFSSEMDGAAAPVTPERICRVNLIKNYEGSALAGSVTGFNANAANTIAAIFAATGQDLAQVVESSSAFCHTEVTEKGDLYLGVSLPSLEVGTVGGGMEFGTARECLDILGCRGRGSAPGDNAKRLAEIVAAAVTAQELNLLGTLASEYELSESHILLARGKK
jgi:hydroxymethylglutaryl-CoA reductase (NADPH)